jgi:hypothetical protein
MIIGNDLVRLEGNKSFVEIKDSDRQLLYSWEDTNLEGPYDILSRYGQSAESPSFWKRLFIPIRTNDLRWFLQDLFLPTFLDTVTRVHHLTDKIFLTLRTLPFDILTFIPRLLAAPFRILYNSLCPPHPLVVFLERLGWIRNNRTSLFIISARVDFTRKTKQEGGEEKVEKLQLQGEEKVSIDGMYENPFFLSSPMFRNYELKYREVEGGHAMYLVKGITKC